MQALLRSRIDRVQARHRWSSRCRYRCGHTKLGPVTEWAGPAPDVIFAGPPCENYSSARTQAKTPRDLKLADSLVRKTVDIIKYFHTINPAMQYFVETPDSSMEEMGITQALRRHRESPHECVYQVDESQQRQENLSGSNTSQHPWLQDGL